MVTVPGNGKWVDSNLRGEVTAESNPRLQDDFAAWANKEEILSLVATTEKNTGSFELLEKNMDDKYSEVINDNSLDTKYAKELKKFVDLARDDELRNSQGVEPLRPYIDAITGITSIEQLITYEKDLEKNPFGLTMITESLSTLRIETADVPVAYLDTLEYTLDSATEYFDITISGLNCKRINDDRTNYLLTRLGFDKKAINKVLKGCYHIESLIAKADSQKGKSGTVQKNYTCEEIEKICDKYPCLDILKSRSAEYKMFQVDYGKLTSVNSLYTDQNLEDIKSYFIVHLLGTTEIFLDHETLAKIYERSGFIQDYSGSVDDLLSEVGDRVIVTYIKNAQMMPALNQVWLDKYYDQRAVDDIEEMTEEYRNYYRELLKNTDWLSEESRKMAIKKLDNMVFYFGKPTITADYEECNIKTKEEGGNLVEACAEAYRYGSIFQRSVVALGDSREVWEPYTTNITECNAYYDLSLNAVYILWGMLQDPVYSPEMTYEQKLGSIGCFIGHEMTHAFDTTGAQSDWKGRINKWMTMEDTAVFREKTSKVASYYSMITPFPGALPINGDSVANEQIADLGGIKGALAIAKKHEGFDYDKFFRSFAHFYVRQVDRSTENVYATTDEHPLNYLRINVGLQQFDEFVETYDIKPGDGMYIAPENRICVW